MLLRSEVSHTALVRACTLNHTVDQTSGCAPKVRPTCEAAPLDLARPANAPECTDVDCRAKFAELLHAERSPRSKPSEKMGAAIDGVVWIVTTIRHATAIDAAGAATRLWGVLFKIVPHARAQGNT